MWAGLLQYCTVASGSLCLFQNSYLININYCVHLSRKLQLTTLLLVSAVQGRSYGQHISGPGHYVDLQVYNTVG